MNLFPIQYFKIGLFSFLAIFFLLSSCKKDDAPTDEPAPIDYGYAIAINSPSADGSYFIGDTLPISINYRSETGEIVHYISVDIYSKMDNSKKIYSVQSHQHVLEDYEYNDNFILKDTTITDFDTDWILEANLWSHDINPDTVSSIIELRVEE